MKNINKILLTISLGGVLLSCNSNLDLGPITEQTENQFYKTETDAFQSLVSVYDVLQWSAPKSQNCPFEVISEQLGDCCYGGGGNANDVPFIVKMSKWQSDVNDPSMEGLWYKYYSGIYRANLFLEKVPAIPFEDAAKKNRFIAEAKFLRANFYFDLVRLFGNVPLITKTLVPSEYYTQLQANPDDVYAQIKTDLVDAIGGGLPLKSDIPVAENGRISKHAAEALLTRVWLYYTGAYGKTDLAGLSKTAVIDYIEDVVKNSGASLLPNFADIFKSTNENNAESIFEIQYSTKSTWGDWGYREGTEGNQAVILWGIRDPQASSPYSSGWSFAPVRASLWGEYTATDTRRSATIMNMAVEGYSYAPGYQNTGFFNKKFTPLKANYPADGSPELNYGNNYPCIRFADVLLMAAELEFDTNLANAQSYYSKVVKRAKGGAFTVPVLTKPLLMKERLLELALEGHRYWDLRRQGLAVAKATIENENSIVADEFKKVYDLKYQGLLPIPQYQLTLCKQLHQNSGY
ncbi:MAG: RagB/SusD family nutrient uptake outer membrane protein [Bacteroidales bacterium]|nr:RagB/SusD family nutrient uptake outer membrane protein [Bacteroidales bacterium]